MRENERASAVTRRHVRTANDPGSLGGRQTVGAFALRTCRKRTNERTNERMTEENLPTSCHKKGRAPEEKRSAEKGRRGFIHPSIGRRSDALFAFIFQSVASSFALRLTYCGSYGFHPERTDGQQTSERAINRSQRAETEGTRWAGWRSARPSAAAAAKVRNVRLYDRLLQGKGIHHAATTASNITFT